MMGRGGRYRYFTYGFFVIIIIGLIVLYHDSQYDIDLLEKDNSKLTNQMNYSLMDRERLTRIVVNLTKENERIRQSLVAKTADYEALQAETERVIGAQKEKIDELNKIVNRLEVYKKSSEVTIHQLIEDQNQHKAIEVELTNNVTILLESISHLNSDIKKLKSQTKKTITEQTLETIGQVLSNVSPLLSLSSSSSSPLNINASANELQIQPQPEHFSASSSSLSSSSSTSSTTTTTRAPLKQNVDGAGVLAAPVQVLAAKETRDSAINSNKNLNDAGEDNDENENENDQDEDVLRRPKNNGFDYFEKDVVDDE